MDSAASSNTPSIKAYANSIPITPEESGKATELIIRLQTLQLLVLASSLPTEDRIIVNQEYQRVVLAMHNLADQVLHRYLPFIRDYFPILTNVEVMWNTLVDSVIIVCHFSRLVTLEQAREFAQEFSAAALAVDKRLARTRRGVLREHDLPPLGGNKNETIRTD